VLATQCYRGTVQSLSHQSLESINYIMIPKRVKEIKKMNLKVMPRQNAVDFELEKVRVQQYVSSPFPAPCEQSASPVGRGSFDNQQMLCPLQ